MKSRYANSPVRMGDSSSTESSGGNNNKSGNKRSRSGATTVAKNLSNCFVPFLFGAVCMFIVFTIFSKQQQQQQSGEAEASHLKVTKDETRTADAAGLSTDKNSASGSTSRSSVTPILTSSQTKVSAAYLRQKQKQQQNQNSNEVNDVNEEKAECGIFLAPSSLKGGTYAPLGIFTTRDIPNGTDIFRGAPNGPAIPLFDVLAGSSHTLAPKRENDGGHAVVVSDGSASLTVHDWDQDDYDDTDQRQFWLAIFNNVRLCLCTTITSMLLMMIPHAFSLRFLLLSVCLVDF
jgi:hypothetical protein